MNLSAARIERFWAKVDVRGPDECWPWTAYRNPRGYGQFCIGGSMARANRIAFVLAFGDPGRLEVMHSCDNPPCCNPKHLSAGTHADNMADMIAKGRQNPATGDRHSSVTHPEKIARGEAHGSRTKPESTPRGVKHGNAKLTDSAVLEIRASKEKQRDLARRYGVAQTQIHNVISRKTWRHVA